MTKDKNGDKAQREIETVRATAKAAKKITVKMVFIIKEK